MYFRNHSKSMISLNYLYSHFLSNIDISLEARHRSDGRMQQT